MGIVYTIRNRTTQKIYVGQTWETLEVRWGRHKSKATHGNTSCRHLYAAIRKYGVSDFDVAQIFEAASQNELDLLEQHWIRVCCSDDRQFGYNLKLGGSAGKHSEETRKRMSAFRKGKHLPGTFPKGVLTSPKPFQKGQRPWNQRFDPPLTPAQRTARYRQRLANKLLTNQ